MGLVLATTFGLVVWIVLWSIGVKAIDAFMITTLVVILGVAKHLVTPHLPNQHG